MITAILILTIFNTGMIIVLGCAVYGAIRHDMINIGNMIIKHTSDYTKYAVESAMDALYNEGSLKQKAEMSGKVEV